MKENQFIIAISAGIANLSRMVKVVSERTGDDNPFFCPQVREGEEYEGHAHTFPPKGAIDLSNDPIELD